MKPEPQQQQPLLSGIPSGATAGMMPPPGAMAMHGMDMLSQPPGPGGPPGGLPDGGFMGGPPPQGIVFAGVSNGEVLWSLPPPNADSPESSNDSASVAGQPLARGNGAGVSSSNLLENLDWVRNPCFFVVCLRRHTLVSSMMATNENGETLGRLPRHIPQ